MSNGKIVPPPALVSGSGLKTLGASSDGDEAEPVPKNLSTNLSLLRPSVLTILLAACFFPKNEFKTDLRPNNCDPFPRNDLCSQGNCEKRAPQAPQHSKTKCASNDL